MSLRHLLSCFLQRERDHPIKLYVSHRDIVCGDLEVTQQHSIEFSLPAQEACISRND